MSDHVRIDLDSGVLCVTLARPEKKNALDEAMYRAMAQAVTRAQDDPAVRVLLFLGEGESFCAGNDISDFLRLATGGQPAADMPVFAFLKGMAHLKKPAVAGVRGMAVGVGATMLLHCDITFAAEDARLVVPFVNLALAPEAASSLLLPARIGYGRAFAMFALGEPLDGRTAAQWGLVNASCPAAEVDEAARQAARALAARPLGSLMATKALMRDGEALWSLMQAEGKVFAERMKSPEAAEAFTAFMERRPPDFTRVG